jgi:3-dehydroquinate synthase
MNFLEQSFSVKFNYTVYFTSDIFHPTNNDLKNFFNLHLESGTRQKILCIIDGGVLKAHRQIADKIHNYFEIYRSVVFVPELIIMEGGEQAKNHLESMGRIIEAIDINGIDRHSYIVAIGGGSVLDLAGFAAGIAHRGIKLIRIPTTVLSQNDSGIGVKNGINYKGKKNFLGTFAPPVAVFNDDLFLSSLDDRDWRSGISEAIKVALIKDADFFYWIETNVGKLARRDSASMNFLIQRCAELHLQHIASGDPFELGSSRPLDFGHWSAHKLEQLTDFRVLHGEAVAMGIALDTVYSALTGRLSDEKADKVVHLLMRTGFEITHPLLQLEDDNNEILQGLEEFREHLGGRLTIMLLVDIGKGEEVHEMDISLLRKAARRLQDYKNDTL